MIKNIKSLYIFSHVTHYVYEGKLFAYDPYVREINNVWFKLFQKIVIVAPCLKEKPPNDHLEFKSNCITINPVLNIGGKNLSEKIQKIFLLPIVIIQICLAMSKAQAIHVRCPGSVGLLAVLLAPLFSRYRVGKYAGQWNDDKAEPVFWRWQKRILKSKWWSSPTMVYGNRSGQPKHIISTFATILEQKELKRAFEIAKKKSIIKPLKILYVGRLSSAKNVDIVIDVLNFLVQQRVDAELTIVGEGDHSIILQEKVNNLNLNKKVVFVGGLAFEEVRRFYEKSNILILVSKTEGWPKVITEAMAYGLLCIASNQGTTSRILGENRGILIESRTPEIIAKKIIETLNAPELFNEICLAAAEWAQSYSIEVQREKLGKDLEKFWRVQVESR